MSDTAELIARLRWLRLNDRSWTSDIKPAVPDVCPCCGAALKSNEHKKHTREFRYECGADGSHAEIDPSRFDRCGDMEPSGYIEWNAACPRAMAVFEEGICEATTDLIEAQAKRIAELEAWQKSHAGLAVAHMPQMTRVEIAENEAATKRFGEAFDTALETAKDSENNSITGEKVLEEIIGGSLFKSGVFKLHSGERSAFKIDCDALTEGDWDTLAFMASEFLPPFGEVVGIPRGGMAFASAMECWVDWENADRRLVVDDVLTTGGSLKSVMTRPTDIGLVAFARGQLPPNVYAVFSTVSPESQLRSARIEGMEKAAKLADEYKDVNNQLMIDSILFDPFLSGKQRTPEAFAKSEEMAVDGCIHSAMFHAAQNIAAAIRTEITKEREANG